MVRIALVVVVFAVAAVQAVHAGSAKKYKNLILEMHNDYRRLQNSSDINELTWSNALAKEADKWLGNCRFEHERSGRGENLVYTTLLSKSAYNMKWAMERWYGEIKDYNEKKPGCGASCHFTQAEVYMDTHYCCRGNFQDEFPYTRGPACSDCWKGQTCHNGLCLGEGRPPCKDKHKDCAKLKEMGGCDVKGNVFVNEYCHEYCPKTCGFCQDDVSLDSAGGGDDSCRDIHTQCREYKQWGACYKYKELMDYIVEYCRKTCGKC